MLYRLNMLRPLLVLILLAVPFLASCAQTPGGGATLPDIVSTTEPSLPAVYTPAFRYGFQVDYGNDYKRAFALVRDANFGWVKLQVRWADLEQTRGKIDWSYLDEVIEEASTKDIKVLLSVTSAPRWVRHQGSDFTVNGPPDDPKQFADFMATLASRYKGKASAYEVWNEPNSSREWGGPNKVSAAEYVAMLKATYGAIKAVDKEAIVLTAALTPSGDVGALARDDVEYFRELYKAGMKGYFDAVAVHASGFNNAPDLDPRDSRVLNRLGNFKAHRSFYFRNFEFYREVMVEEGDRDKEIWFTEFGWASGDAPDEWAYAREISEQTQADYIVQAFQMGKSRDYIGVMFLWNLNFFGNDFAKRAFAVLKPDWSPRASYRALAAMPK